MEMYRFGLINKSFWGKEKSRENHRAAALGRAESSEVTERRSQSREHIGDKI
jgi:hypothetical protein